MATTTFVRADQALITAKVNGVNLPKTVSWAQIEGGDIEAEDVFTRPGGGLHGVNLGGPTKRTDVTVMRQYTAELQGYIVELENKCGSGAASVSYTMLDADNNPTGQTVTMTGILKNVVKPNFNANSAEAVFLGLVISCDTEATSS